MPCSAWPLLCTSRLLFPRRPTRCSTSQLLVEFALPPWPPSSPAPLAVDPSSWTSQGPPPLCIPALILHHRSLLVILDECTSSGSPPISSVVALSPLLASVVRSNLLGSSIRYTPNPPPISSPRSRRDAPPWDASPRRGHLAVHGLLRLPSSVTESRSCPPVALPPRDRGHHDGVRRHHTMLCIKRSTVGARPPTRVVVVCAGPCPPRATASVRVRKLAVRCHSGGERGVGGNREAP